MKFIAVVCVVVFALLEVAFGYRNPVCSLPPAADGDCFAPEIRYSYHAKTNTCKIFIYGGCGGNANSFETFEECQATCTCIYRYTDRTLQNSEAVISEPTTAEFTFQHR